MSRNRERSDGAWAQDAHGFAQRRYIILEVLDHLPEHNRVEGRVCKWQRGDVGAQNCSPHPLAENVAGRLRDVGTDDVEAPVLEQARERALPGPGVEDLPSGCGRKEEPEKELLAQLMTRPDEIRRATPFVSHLPPQGSV
jgi:hypothetical protein